MSKPNLSLNPVRSGADREPRDEAGAIADDAHLAVKLHIVEIQFLGAKLDGVG